MSYNGFEENEEFKEVFAKLNRIKNMDLTPPDPTYFSTLLARTRQRIEQEKSLRSRGWKNFFSFFRSPVAALSMAMVLIVLFFSISELGDIPLFRQKNVYSSLAQELELLGPHATHPEDDVFLLEELGEMNDEQLNNLLKSLET